MMPWRAAYAAAAIAPAMLPPLLPRQLILLLPLSSLLTLYAAQDVMYRRRDGRRYARVRMLRAHA